MGRRDFLVLTGGMLAAIAASACRSGKEEGTKTRGTSTGPTDSRRTLRIATWKHTVADHDAWFDNEFIRLWGETNGIEVVVDHFDLPDLTARASIEVAAASGHDLFYFLSPQPIFEDDVIDHRELVEEVTAKVGPLTPFMERSVHNPRTGKYFAFPDMWAAFPAVYRVDLWGRAGNQPDSWEDLRSTAPELKIDGHPVGFALSQGADANASLLSLLASYGASIQNESGRPMLDSPATIEAVKVVAELFRGGMPDEVLTWDYTSNNRFMASGLGSWTLNPVSALRAAERQNPELATKLSLAPTPEGPAGRISVSPAIGSFVIWRFARNPEAAGQFLVDLALNAREAFIRSEYFNLPAWPGTVSDLAALLDGEGLDQRYEVLGSAAEWSTNPGHPGTTNAAINEIWEQFVIPDMFVLAVTGKATPEEATRIASSRVNTIFDKWRGLGRI